MKKYIIGSLFAIAAVACTSVSTTTTLKGKFSGADVPEEITVSVPGMIDTTIQLRNAAFKLEIPVNKAVLGEINVGGPKGRFISDGTVLTVDLNDGLVEVTSDKPAASVTAKFNAFADEHKGLVASYRSTMVAISDSTGLSAQQKDSLQEEFYNSFNDKYNEFNTEAVKKQF